MPILKRILRITVFTFGIATIVILALTGLILYNTPEPDSHAAAVHHEFQVQAAELDRRIRVCNNMIDGMLPGTNYINGAASHCALMWLQMKHLQLFVTEQNISDPTIAPLIESSFRAAARYAEYQKAMDHPQYNPYE